ncbi:MAG: RidA family protein [Proteobacteria bacterium]|nr:RidA family protein [Pseudomonadota bacterium]
MGKRVLKSAKVRAKGSYSAGWEVSGGRLVFVAGQIPWDADGQTVCKGDVAGQTRQVFTNIGAVLAEAGGTLDDVVKITVFAADIRYRDAINQVRTETFKEPYPASTQVAVASLVDPEWLVEIEAIAFIEG